MVRCKGGGLQCTLKVIQGSKFVLVGVRSAIVALVYSVGVTCGHFVV